MGAVKVIKVLGTSEESWEDAAEQALMQATSTVQDISGMKIKDWSATIEDNTIVEYKTTVEIAFPVQEH